MTEQEKKNIHAELCAEFNLLRALRGIGTWLNKTNYPPHIDTGEVWQLIARRDFPEARAWIRAHESERLKWRYNL